MTSMLAIIREIDQEPSRLGKERLLAHLLEHEDGPWLLNWVYNPMITFGIRPGAPDPAAKTCNVKFNAAIVDGILKRLASRELTGNLAEREIFDVMSVMDKDAAELLYRIISKDLKCGIGDSTIQKMAPGLIPVFCVMRAQAFEEGKIKKWPQKAEYKLDGQRNAFVCRDGFGAFFTRSGKVVPALEFLVPVIQKVLKAIKDYPGALNSMIYPDGADKPSIMLDGEAMMGLFAETGALRRKDTDAVGAEFHLYDIMSYADFNAVGSVGLSLNDRREMLNDFVIFAKKVLTGKDAEILQIVPQFFVNSDADVIAFFNKARSKTLASYMARGNAAREEELLKTTIDKATGKPKVLEGAMIKNPDGLYDKKKSRNWLKVKASETEDLRIIGAYPGEERTKYEDCLGGLVVDRSGVRVRCGGGFTDEERIELWKLWGRDLAYADQSLLVKDKDAVIYTGVLGTPKLFGRLIEIEFHEVTPDGSLRHPRFIRFRDDKDGEVESKDAA